MIACKTPRASSRDLGLVLDRLMPDELVANERRGGQRAAFSYRFRLIPLDRSEGSATSLWVVGRDLSSRGVGFRHEAPLPFRRVLLEADDPRLTEMGLGGLRIEAVLRWCRFVGEGEYESGGSIARSLVA